MKRLIFCIFVLFLFLTGCDPDPVKDVTDLKVVPGNASVTVSWTAPESKETISYIIKYKVEGEEEQIFSGTANPSGTVIPNIPNGKECQVIVIAKTENSSSEGISKKAIPLAEYQPPGKPLVNGSEVVTSTSTPSWAWSSNKEFPGNGNFRYKLNDPDLTEGAIETIQKTFRPDSPLDDGVYTLYVQEQNNKGFWSESGTFTTTVSASSVPKPSVAIKNAVVEGGVAYTNSPKPEFVFTAGDSNRFDKFCFSVAGGSNIEQVDSTYIPDSNLEENKNLKVIIYTVDKFKKASAVESFSFYVDTKAPTITLNSHAAAPENFTNILVPIDLNAENITSLADYEPGFSAIDDNPVFGNCSVNVDYSTGVDTSVPGTVQITYSAEDPVGNFSSLTRDFVVVNLADCIETLSVTDSFPQGNEIFHIEATIDSVDSDGDTANLDSELYHQINYSWEVLSGSGPDLDGVDGGDNSEPSEAMAETEKQELALSTLELEVPALTYNPTVIAKETDKSVILRLFLQNKDGQAIKVAEKETLFDLYPQVPVVSFDKGKYFKHVLSFSEGYYDDWYGPQSTSWLEGPYSSYVSFHAYWNESIYDYAYNASDEPSALRLYNPEQNPAGIYPEKYNATIVIAVENILLKNQKYRVSCKLKNTPFYNISGSTPYNDYYFIRVNGNYNLIAGHWNSVWNTTPDSAKLFAGNKEPLNNTIYYDGLQGEGHYPRLYEDAVSNELGSIYFAVYHMGLYNSGSYGHLYIYDLNFEYVE